MYTKPHPTLKTISAVGIYNPQIVRNSMCAVVYKIKSIPEDFVVDEMFSRPLLENGKYAIYKLTKRERNTIDVISEISNIFNTKVGFSGNKDRNAVTTQYISVYYTNPKKEIVLKNANAVLVGFSDQPISLGDHDGNKFLITLRDLDEKEIKLLKKKLVVDKSKEQTIEFINYFGDQRFGTNNVEIAKSILHKDFKKACELMDDIKLKEFLEKSEHDYSGALRVLPKHLLNMIINSYQSYLWNLCVKEFKDEKIPMPGFGIEFKNKKIEEFYNKEMKKDKLTMRDFIIRSIPNLLTEGVIRDRMAVTKEFSIVKEGKDEIFDGKYKIVLSFVLSKGSYATVFIESMFEK